MRIGLYIFCVLVAIGTQAQDSTVVTNFKDTVAVVQKDTTFWQKSFSGGINFNQASFSNWVGGGVNSVALSGVIAARALYERERIVWDNTLDGQLGYVTQRGLTRKAADQLNIISVLGYKISPVYDLFASATFNTFVAPGYRYENLRPGETELKISNFLAPGQLTLAWGVAYRPSDWFSVRVSPFAPRFTFLADQSVRVRTTADGTVVPDPTQTAYGVAPGRSVRIEWLAFQLQAVLNKNVASNVNLNARYQLFANYQELSKINHRLDLVATAKVNRYLSTTFGLIMLYNPDFASTLQVQQSLALGLLYNVSTFRKK